MKKFFLFLTTLTTLMFTSCNNEDSNDAQSYPYQVRMTDAPAPYDAVYVDVQGVEVITTDGATFALATQAQVYNLLELSNGINVQIANATLPNPNVSQVRLILGPNNSIVVDGVTYPLATPSAQQSGLKLQVNQQLVANGDNILLLDFDAHQSIVEQGNGSYSLKPVIRVINSSAQGSVSGTIPAGIPATVTAESSTGVQFTTIVSPTGAFQLSGLASGTYTITITPALPLVPKIITNVSVSANSTTSLGAITLE